MTSPPRRVVALIGDPVAHSISPAMHRAAFGALGLDLDYVALTVRKEELADAFPPLRQTYLGLNVTTPLKEAVIPLLETITPLAGRAGSVNTVSFSGGRSEGSSTDGEGFLAALRNGIGRADGRTDRAEFPGQALVLGTGGAARAVAAALLAEGARVTVCGRNAEAGSRLARHLGSRFMSVDAGSLAGELGRADLLVNATPVGGPGDADAAPLPDTAPLPPRLVVFDLVYRPRRTVLLARAEVAGCRIVEGIEMLIEQAARSFEIWTGRPGPVNVMREAAYAALDAGEREAQPSRPPRLAATSSHLAFAWREDHS